MLRSLLAAAVLASASVTLAAPTDHLRNATEVGHRCGSTPSPEYIAVAEAHFAEHQVLPELIPGRARVIYVCFHVIYKDKTIHGGYLPHSQITKQIKRLNVDFSGTGYSFALARTTRTRNAKWFDNAGPDTPQQTAMKKALRIGGVTTLNLYSVGFVSEGNAGLLGYATFPWSYSSAPKDDGVVFLYSSVPGGTTAHHNLGRTLTHEVGHWVGLYHPFEGGCSKPNDFVADTPQEAYPAFGCPVGGDSCGSTGLDPVHNYMDYTDDSCKNQFTPGQIRRLRAQLATYRGI